MLRLTKTENGAVRGFPGTDARITVFKGIPYAAPSGGENRWKAPQPATNWDGVKDCYEFGQITMQQTPGKNPDAFYSKEWHVDSEVPMGEENDLCLNIWTPAKAADEKLPVMVWIFGGGLREGYAHEMEFDGERIASRGVILVSVSYRLNVFGFLAHPELTAEDPEHPTNFGLLDQQAGIKWVKRNIANFGGDPDNITIFGQSAGGWSILAQMCSPHNDGLFQRGIIESIGGMRPLMPTARSMPSRDLHDAEQEGVDFLKELGVSTIAEARKLDAVFIRDKFLEKPYFWGGVEDGKFLTESFDETLLKGTLKNRPFMIGNTTDEFPILPEGETDDEVKAWVNDRFGEYADQYLALCAKKGGTLKQAATAYQMEIGNILMCDVLAKQGGYDYWYYRFGPSMPGDNAGAFHSSDLWFEFETLAKCWRPFDGHHFDLSRKMCNYWTNFAKYGDPNGNDADGTPMPEWEKYSADNRRCMQFYDDISMGDVIRDESEQLIIDINLKMRNA